MSEYRDPRVRNYISPVRVAWQSEFGVSNAQSLIEPGKPPCRLSTGGDAPDAENTQSGTVPGILLDFGREIHGGFEYNGHGSRWWTPVRMRVRFGESVGEAMGEPINAHGLHDFVVPFAIGSRQEVGQTGFRFLRLDLVEPNEYIDLGSIRAVSLQRDLDYLGSFTCSDPRLDQIWLTGAYTVQLCMQDLVWDGIKRDRCAWMGDLHPEVEVISRVFGKQAVVADSLDQLRDHSPLPGWMQGISSYSIWWIIVQWSWYLYHGDRDYLAEQRSYLTELLRQMAEFIAPDGAENLPALRFLDHHSSESPASIHAGLQALMVMGFDAGRKIADVLGDTSLKERCVDAVQRLKQHVPPLDGLNKTAASVVALSELMSPSDVNNGCLSVNPSSGLSTFYGYYALQARALAGDYSGCLALIREYWGSMLDRGATTFWEHFDMDWLDNSGRIDELTPVGMKDIHADFGAYCYVGLRHSLCHGWAAGPTAWLSEHVLGIQPVEPGCRAILIAPHLGDLTWAQGTFPTPRGIVTVRHERGANGRIKSSVEVPEGIKADVMSGY